MFVFLFVISFSRFESLVTLLDRKFMEGVQFSFLSNVTPRNLKCSTALIGCPHSRITGSGPGLYLLEKVIRAHLLKKKFSRHSWVQLSTSVRYAWSISSDSCGKGVDVWNLMSSAKRDNSISFPSGRGKSLIMMFHSMGLRTHPCGTPLVNFQVLEK